MNLRKLFVAFTFLTLWGNLMAQQPFGGCWHPDNVINWSPEKDPDAKFNRSTMALQPRMTDTSIKANKFQKPDAKVSVCLTMNPMCSQTPSQGAENFIGYNPTYWQYMDLLIWWGGSAGEGIVIPPSAPVTDIAHLNGVKVLGQVFFPPREYGGQEVWVDEMLTEENGTYPYAKKMFEIAAYYGFDGWFINEETKHGSDYSTWVKWIEYFEKCAQEAGHPEMCIQWYDNGIGVEGKEDLVRLNNTSYFLDYRSPEGDNVKKQMENVQKLGFTREQAFEKIYFGFLTSIEGINAISDWKKLIDGENHLGSFDIFNPEEPIWKQQVKSLLETENACGEQAYAAMDKVFKNEARYWTNRENDPSNTEGLSSGYWPGFADALLERSTIQSIPFVTSFSAGLGKARYVNGQNMGTHDWYHRGMQDILPTWRWWVDVPQANKGDLKFDLNWDDAYNAGTSVKVSSANLKSGVDYLTRLYKTNLKVESGTEFQLVVKGNLPTIELQLGLNGNNKDLTSFNLTSKDAGNGWKVLSADLSSIANKTISVIALNFKGDNKACDFLMGKLAVLPAGYNPTVQAVSNLQCQNKLSQDGGDLRLIWDAPKSKDIHHFNVYLIRDGKRTLVGQTRNEGFYCSKFTRNGMSEKSVKAEVVPVSQNLVEGTASSIEVSYPEMDKPEVQIIASKTLVKVGERVELTAIASNFPESYSWVVPENAKNVLEEGNKLVLKFQKEGLYDISVKVTNKVGETTATVQGLVFVSNKKAEELTNVAVGKKIHSSSGYLGQESPENLIDGVQIPGDIHGKWCIGGKKEHWVILDLKESYEIYGFQFFDCGNKENPLENVQSYKIWVSDDVENWGDPVVDATNRPEDTKIDYIKAKGGRYVKFMPYDNDKPITIRIWEFEVFALEGGPLFKVEKNLSLDFHETKEMSFVYDLNGEEMQDDFNVSIVPDKEGVVTISDILVDKEQQKVTYKINALEKTDNTNVNVTVTNKGWNKVRSTFVEVIDSSLKNVLSNRIAYVYENYFDNPETKEVKELTDGDYGTGYNTFSDVGGETTYITFDCEKTIQFSKANFSFQVFEGNTYANNVRVAVSETGADDSFVEVASSVVDEDNAQLNFILDSEKAIGRYIRFYLDLQPFMNTAFAEIEAYGKETTTGLDKNMEENEIIVSPTIVDSSFDILGGAGKKVEIFNLTGSKIFETTIDTPSFMVSTSAWNAGVYFVKVGNKVVKVIRK